MIFQSQDKIKTKFSIFNQLKSSIFQSSKTLKKSKIQQTKYQKLLSINF